VGEPGNFPRNSVTPGGTLFVVATPIGNLADMSLRAIEVLKQVEVIAAEDTRTTQKLLNHYGITTRLTAYHDFSDQSATQRILQKLTQGESVALVSDAGTPLISDPGYGLVAAARSHGMNVIPIPGPSALIAALSVAGLPTDRFIFEGFLPAKAGARDKRLMALITEQRTLIFYEAPHRINAMLESCASHFESSRQVCLGRELTKKFEQHFCGTLAMAKAWLTEHENHMKGEFVVVFAGGDETAWQEARLEKAEGLVAELRKEMSMKKAVAFISTFLGLSKNELYRRVLERDH
jgi:16S rRNA (cytidine1402-2'-O)-methyltransferase